MPAFPDPFRSRPRAALAARALRSLGWTLPRFFLPGIALAITPWVLLLRAGMTTSDARHRQPMRAHQVIGPPTVMLFDAAGRERQEARGLGEFTVKPLLQGLAGAPEQGA